MVTLGGINPLKFLTKAGGIFCSKLSESESARLKIKKGRIEASYASLSFYIYIYTILERLAINSAIRESDIEAKTSDKFKASIPDEAETRDVSLSIAITIARRLIKSKDLNFLHRKAE